MPDERLLATAAAAAHARHAEEIYAFDEGDEGVASGGGQHDEEEIADSEDSSSEEEEQQVVRRRAPRAAASRSPAGQQTVDLTVDTSSDEDSDEEILGGAAGADPPTAHDAPKTRRHQRLNFMDDPEGKLEEALADPQLTARTDPMLCPFISNKSPRHLVRIIISVPCCALVLQCSSLTGESFAAVHADVREQIPGVLADDVRGLPPRACRWRGDAIDCGLLPLLQASSRARVSARAGMPALWRDGQETAESVSSLLSDQARVRAKTGRANDDGDDDDDNDGEDDDDDDDGGGGGGGRAGLVTLHE